MLMTYLKTVLRQVHNLGQGIRDWKIKTFGLKEKRKETMKEEDLGEGGCSFHM